MNGSDTILPEPVSASSREQMNCIAAFMTQLLPGMKLLTYGRQSFDQNQIDNGFDTDNQACIYPGVIVISDTLRDADVLIREFLRPFVETLLHKQSGLYHRLLEEAKIAFPSLYQQIQDRYNNYSNIVQDKETFTDALTKYFLEDLGEGKRHHHKLNEDLYQFIDLNKSLFGIDMGFDKNEYGNQIIPIDRLINIESLNDLAMLLNTRGISFNICEGIDIFHLESK